MRFQDLPGTFNAAVQSVRFTLGTDTFSVFGLPSIFVEEDHATLISADPALNPLIMQWNRVFRKDLTDGAGHGYLVATDSIFARLSSTLTGLTNTADVRLLYRFKEVPLAEYIGIVQSQS